MNIKQSLQQAINHHQSGQLQDAKQIYCNILQIEPKHSDANHNLGLLLVQEAQPDAALVFFMAALESNPNSTQFWVSYIDTLIHVKQFDMAEKILKEGRANGLEGEVFDRLETSLASQVEYNHSHLLQTQIDSILTRYFKGQTQEALNSLEILLINHPNESLLYNIRGSFFESLGQLDEAVNNFKQALKIKPGFMEAHYNLGNALQKSGQLNTAVKCYEQALAIEPGFADAHYNLGIAHQHLGQLESALMSYEQTLKIKPDFAEAHCNVGIILQDLGQVNGAITYYKQALKFNPDYIDARWNLSLAQLLTGSFKESWANYEWRWKTKVHEPERHYPKPFWNGSSLTDKTLFLYCEQGAGDAILFIRYVKVVSSSVTKIIVECPPSLYRLFSTIMEIDTLVTQGDNVPYFDFHAPLLSIPGILNTTLENIPANIPYFFSDNCTTASISAKQDILKIGIVWAGNPTQRDDKKRSVNLSWFSTIINIAGTQFYSLQVGDQSNDLKKGNVTSRIIDLGDLLGDYADTASIINQLDLVITVDTSVAHLAGAMGKPVWVLLSFSAYWVWLLNRHDSPWYPTARLFRQKELNNWESVFTEVNQALKEKCK